MTASPPAFRWQRARVLTHTSPHVAHGDLLWVRLGPPEEWIVLGSGKVGLYYQVHHPDFGCISATMIELLPEFATDAMLASLPPPLYTDARRVS